MDVLEARGVIAAMLAEKLELTPGQTFFTGAARRSAFP